MATAGSTSLHLEDMFQYLESPDTKQNIKQVILENLASIKEPWLVHLLVDYYFRTQSKNVQEILGQVRESNSKALMEKLQDGIKTLETRLPALQLMLFLVYKELPWCHQLLESPLFSAVLKCLKSDVDVPVLMTSLMIVVILLPSAPVTIGPHLPHIFDIFGRLCLFCMRRPANTPDVFFLHLQVALYSLFHRLYGMYPCKFLEFIAKFFGQKEHIHAYEEVILPMLERVRLHPGLVMGNRDNEIAKSRWKNQETQDIIVSCSKLSLDMIEGSWEDSHCPIFHSVNDLSKYRKMMHEGCQIMESNKENEVTTQPIGAIPEENYHHQLVSSCMDLGVVGESPSVLIGLSTPPSSHRNTPGASFLDANISGGTPDAFSRQPTPCCYTDEVDKGDKTPLSRSSSKSIIQQPLLKSWEGSSKKPGLVTPKASAVLAPNTTPVTPSTTTSTAGAFVSPNAQMDATSSTPLKSRYSAFDTPRSPATRTLNFSTSEEQEESSSVDADAQKEDVSCGIEIKIEEEKDNGDVSGEGGGNTEDVETGDDRSKDDPDDLEVKTINEQEDKFDAETSPASSVSTLASQTDVTAESVRQFMKKVNRIRFNSLTSNSSSDQDACPKKGIIRKRMRARSCPPFKRPGHRVNRGDWALDARQRGAGVGERSSLNSKGNSKKISSWVEKEGLDGSQKTEEISEESSEETSSSSQGATYKSALREPVYQMFRQSTQSVATQVSPPFPCPVNPALQFLFAPAKLSLCTSCSEELVVSSGHSQSPPMPGAGITTATTTTTKTTSTTTTTIKGTEISLFHSWPAPELLDQYLKIGSDLHAKELTHIPLTSKETVNWTHFGGVPPADEVNILKGQTVLLHTQLLYERHKRLNHAKRNRRLLRKIAHVPALEVQQKTLLNQIKMQEQEIQQLSVSVKLLQGDNRRLSQTQESEEYQKLVHYKTALKENKDLKASSVQLKNLLVTQREDYEKLQKKLENVQHRNQDNEKELQICKERLANTEILKSQVFHLEKEVLLMQELQQKCQEKLHHSLPSNQIRVELNNMITSLQTQLADGTKETKKNNKLLKTFQAMAADMESKVKAKEEDITKMKADISRMRSSHTEQTKALEDRRITLAHINHKLESKIMELQCQLDQQQHRKMMAALKANRARGGHHPHRHQEPSSLPPDQKQPDDSAVRSRRSSTRHTSDETGTGKEEKPSTPAIASDNDGISSQSLPSAFNGRGDVVAGDHQLASSSVRPRTETEVIDSGVASRSSYHLDSDVSLHSVSGNSIATNDSGLA